jgi:phosphatidate cytidylyltransferase
MTGRRRRQRPTIRTDPDTLESSDESTRSSSQPTTPTHLRRGSRHSDSNSTSEHGSKHGYDDASDTGASVTLLANESAEKKWRNFSVRTVWTLIMISAFFLIMAAGHFWVVLMVIGIQTVIFKEVISIAHVPAKERKLPWFRTINWYFLLVANYFLYGESLIRYFRQYMLVDAFLLPLATHHRFISYIGYMIGKFKSIIYLYIYIYI